MSLTDKYLYTLTSCDPTSYDDIINLSTNVSPSPFSGLVVYIDQTFPYYLSGVFQGQTIAQARTYVLTPIGAGANTAQMTQWVPTLVACNLTSCADANADKMYKVSNCLDRKSFRYVLFVAAQTIGDVVNFTGECTCWKIEELISTYTESLTVAATYTTCSDCIGVVEADICSFGVRTIGYALRVQDVIPETPDRGFGGCCYSSPVFGDLTEPNNAYHNDFTSVYFQRQTPVDTVAYQIIKQGAGTTNLVGGTHGDSYVFDPLHTNPDLSYFRVSWHDILNTLGAGVYTIRMQVSIAGLPVTNVDTPMTFNLKAWSINGANGTARLDIAMDGTIEDTGINFKDSEFTTSLRTLGYFGDAQDNVTQHNTVYSSSKGLKMYEGQITMNNDPTYTFQADNISECISRYFRKFFIFANDIYASDYNKNNHSYEYELLPVVLDGIETNTYPVEGRGMDMNLTFKRRSKNDRKTNC